MDESPDSRDPEEIIEVIRVSIPELRKIMMAGEMLPPSIITSYMAMNKLQEFGFLE